MKPANISVGCHSVSVVSLVHERFYCLLCGSVLENPHQAPCGCRFCFDCITDYLRYAERICPGKTEDCLEVNLNVARDLRVDVLAKREISKLVVKCCFESCNKECELREMRNHLVLCASESVQCNLCEGSITRGEYEAHKTNYCLEGIVNCGSCNQMMIRRHMNEKHLNYEHELLCELFSDYCPNECEEKTQVVWMEHRRMCKKKSVSCPYQTIGCTSSNLTVRHLCQHMAENGFEHAEVLLKHIDNLNNEIAYLKSTISSVTNENVAMANRCGNQAREIETLGDKIVVLNNSIEGMKEDNLRTLRQIQSKIKVETASSIRAANTAQGFVTNQINGDLARLKVEVETMSTSLKRLGDVSTDVRSLRAEIAELKKCGAKSKEPSFVWKLDDFVTIHLLRSPTFYTHPGGYELTLSIEKTKKGYMSLYVQLHCGESDEDLAWPFRKSITLQIVDQERLGRDFERVVLYNEKAGPVCERKYSADTGDFGFSKFIAYQELKEKSYLLMNNRMRIRCFVHELNV